MENLQILAIGLKSVLELSSRSLPTRLSIPASLLVLNPFNLLESTLN